jgi:uncharacterized protein YcbK (DUF882 family)
MNTNHFKDSELTCRCGCGSFIDNVALKIALEDVREHFNSSVIVNCGTRCTKHNDEVGGAEFSWHLSGHAADIVVKGVHPDSVYRYLNNRPYADLIGLGSYQTFTHVDARGKRARW